MASVEVRSARKSTALRARNGPSKLQPARSMPLDYRYSAAANGSGGVPAANGSGRRAAAAEAEQAEKEGEVAQLEVDDADSPYSSKAATAEEVAEMDGGDEEVDSASAATPTPRRLSPTAAASPTHGDARWGDISSYNAKKKHRVFCQLPNGDWALCTVLTTSVDESVLKVSEGKVLRLKTESLQPANPEILDGVDHQDCTICNAD